MRIRTFILAALIVTAFSNMGAMAEDTNGFTKTNVTSQYLDMIYKQQHLIQDFDTLLNQSYFQLGPTENATFIKSFQILLNNQSLLDKSFGDILGNQSNWNFTKNTTKVMFLGNYSGLIDYEMVIYRSYYNLMSISWCQTAFKSSDSGYIHAKLMRTFQDLLMAQNDLILHYGDLLVNMGNEVPVGQRRTALLEYSNLMASHADLLLNVKEKIQNPCTTYHAT